MLVVSAWNKRFRWLMSKEHRTLPVRCNTHWNLSVEHAHGGATVLNDQTVDSFGKHLLIYLKQVVEEYENEIVNCSSDEPFARKM